MKDLWDNKIVPVLIIIVAVGIFVWIGFILIKPDHAYGAVSPTQEQPFDHSQCQYPNRASNPVDGCDNTDPADPLAVKGGLESINNTNVAPAASQSVKASNCTEN